MRDGSAAEPRGRLARFAPVLGAVALLAATIAWVEPAALAARLRALDAGWLALGVACAVPVYVAFAARWWWIARALDAPIGLARAHAEYALSTFLNQALPLGIAGDAARAVRHGARLRRAGAAAPTAHAVAAVVVERVVGLVGLGLAIAGAAAWAGASARPLVALAGGVEVAAIALVVVLLTTRRGAGRLGVLGASARRALRRPATLAPPVALSLLGTAALVAQFHAAARAVGGAPSFAASAAVVPVVLGAAMVPLAFAGWGAREAVAAALWGALGLSTAAGAAAGVAFGAVTLLASAPGLVVLLLPEAGDALAARRRVVAQSVAVVGATAAALATGRPILASGIGALALVAAVLVPGARAGGRVGRAANAVTAVRLVAVAAGAAWATTADGATLALAVGGLLALDLVDGALARRFGGDALGAAFDMETDALLVLGLAVVLHARGDAGGWILIAGLWRYAYAAIVARWPGSGEEPRSAAGRWIAGGAMLGLTIAPALGARGWIAAALATAAITGSFARSLAWTYRRTTQSKSTSGPSAT
jgi:uncharacterized membrane protein YbhN (UPF0104 family)